MLVIALSGQRSTGVHCEERSDKYHLQRVITVQLTSEWFPATKGGDSGMLDLMESPTDIYHGGRLVERQADRVPIVNGPDGNPGWITGEEFHLVVVHEVEHSPNTLEIVGPDSHRDAMIVVKRDHRRMEEGECLRGCGTVILADPTSEACPSGEFPLTVSARTGRVVVRTALQPALDGPGAGGAEAVEEALDLAECGDSGRCSNLLGRPLRQAGWIERHRTQKPLCICLCGPDAVTLGTSMQDDAVVIADCRRGVTERTRLVDFTTFEFDVLHARPRNDGSHEFQARLPKFVPTTFRTLPDELALEFREMVAHVPAIITVYLVEYP